jgi:hypothetical protein
MALKKSQLYSSLWQSCDELRGGMDASQFKDYVLTLLFMKYVSDKYAGKLVPQPGMAARTDIGWVVCAVSQGDLAATRGVVVPEFPQMSGPGLADDLLNVQGRAAGVIEAEKAGHTLMGVETRPPGLSPWRNLLCLVYQST